MGLLERLTDREEGRRARWVIVGALAAALIVFFVFRLQGPPQIGADEEVFREVDALFTAVTARDVGRLAECEQRLRAYRDAAKLPAKPADYLDGVIAQARDGEWEPAARRLYDFMLGQRRESDEES